MRKSLLVVILLSGSFSVFGQEARLIAFSELEKQYTAMNDTTYIVNFWATWCAPCVKELPVFQQLKNRYKNEKLKVLLVSLDFPSRRQQVNKMIKTKKINLHTVLLNEKDPANFIDRVSPLWSGSIPATLVINHEKKYRQFYEREFSFQELEKEYQRIN